MELPYLLGTSIQEVTYVYENVEVMKMEFSFCEKVQILSLDEFLMWTFGVMYTTFPSL